MIKVNSLFRNYGDFKAVDDVSFEINKGEVVGLLGHNGAGKTTIMKMMTGYLEPTSGSIEVDQLQIDTDTRAIQARIGYLPENCPVWPEMTVIDYLKYQAHLHGVEDVRIQPAVVDAVRRTSLKEKATSSIQTLSRGYRQRVGVAQAIIHSPNIIILDEPTNFLDRDSLGALALAIKEFKGGLFMISHNAEFYEALCPEKWILESGRLTVMGAEWMEEVEKARKKAEKLAAKQLNFNQEEEQKDALGNTIVKAPEEVKELSRADKKRLQKQRKEMLKRGEDTYEIDLQLGLE